jgi:hypothetical protein
LKKPVRPMQLKGLIERALIVWSIL